jgi:hypothetical protein
MNKNNDWDADKRRFSGCYQIKSPLIPLQWGKGAMIHRIPVNSLSSLWKRETGRDFLDGRFKPRNRYDFYYFLKNKKDQSVKTSFSAQRSVVGFPPKEG